MNEEKEQNWQKFAKLAVRYNSKYLNNQDRKQMVSDIYQLEGGELNSDFESVYKNIADRLAILILRLEKSFNWGEFVEGFSKRTPNSDLIDIVARDLLLIEEIQKKYQKIHDQIIGENYKTDNNLEMEAFKIAYYLYFNEKYKNYYV